MSGEPSDFGRPVQGLIDWPRVRRNAERRLRIRLQRRGVLTPAQAACTAAAALPRSLRRGLLDALRRFGWLSPDARLPFDILDSAACPPAFRGAAAPLVHLALFGLPGQGRPAFKHREAAYQQICAQIMREANDLPTLSGAATRALSHPDVCGDPSLASMIRSFIAEREAALRTKKRVEHPEPEDESQLKQAFGGEFGASEFPTRVQLTRAFARHEKEFEVQLAQYNDAAARYALDQMQDLARRFPVHVDAAALRTHEQQFEEFTQRCAAMSQQIEDVARQAATAARQGDHKTASWLIGRLRAIHALTPVLLPAERFEKLREEIDRSGRKFEQHEALQDLITREREVATEIKQAAAAIYRFRKVAKVAPPQSEGYKRAELAYRQAVIRVRFRDTDWLAGLLLELETLLRDLDDPAGRANEQLDRFIGTVRTALNQLRLEIRAIQQERAGPTTGAPAASVSDKADAVSPNMPPPPPGIGDAAAAPPA